MSADQTFRRPFHHGGRLEACGTPRVCLACMHDGLLVARVFHLLALLGGIT